MFKNLTQVYSLIVCLVASVVMMITIGVMLGSGTDFVFIEYKYNTQNWLFINDIWIHQRIIRMSYKLAKRDWSDKEV